jgi:hypothetical protein
LLLKGLNGKRGKVLLLKDVEFAEVVELVELVKLAELVELAEFEPSVEFVVPVLVWLVLVVELLVELELAGDEHEPSEARVKLAPQLVQTLGIFAQTAQLGSLQVKATQLVPSNHSCVLHLLDL